MSNIILRVAVAVTVMVAVAVLTGDSDGVAAPYAGLQCSKRAKVLKFNGFKISRLFSQSGGAIRLVDFLKQAFSFGDFLEFSS